MSAEYLGNQLLQEVEEESLDALLRSLRSSLDPSPSALGILALDELLEIFQPPFKSDNPSHSTPWPTDTPTSNPQPVKELTPAVLEITGASPCSGKTQLLYYLTTITLLPSSYGDIQFDGKEQTVVLLDLSGRFSVPSLQQIMHCYISTKHSMFGTRLNEEDTASLTHDSLRQLHVFRPRSTESLLATISTLPNYLLAQPSSHFSANRSLGLLAINDISAFFHQDRQSSEEDATSTIPERSRTPGSRSLLQEYYNSLVTVLRETQILFSSPLVVTNHALSTPTNRRSTTPSLRPHLPGVWNNFCTLQVVVERDSVTKFGPGMSVEEASRERTQRWEAVSRSGFSGWVNWWGSGGWRAEVKEGLRTLERGGRFNFWVGEGGVTFDRIED